MATGEVQAPPARFAFLFGGKGLGFRAVGGDVASSSALCMPGPSIENPRVARAGFQSNAFKRRTNMAGVSVGGRFFFAFDCETIDVDALNFSDGELLPLLECFGRGEFTRVKAMNLVVPLHCTPHFLFLTHAMQKNSNIGNGGAKLIGEGLKVNSSLQNLLLVSHLFLSF